MTHLREADLPREASRRLSRLIERDSKLNVRLLMPGLVVFNGLFALCVHLWPGRFLARNGHVWLIAAQFLGLTIYLYYVIRFSFRRAPIVATPQEERRALATNH